MAKFPSKRVTTKLVLQWDGEKYVELERDSYDYDGPWALATHDRQPTWVIGDYRWREDDGSESAATWAKAENTALNDSGYGPGLQIRLRMNFGETNAATTNNSGSWTLQYRVDGGSWGDVPVSTGAVHLFDSSNLTNGTSISTERLTTGTIVGSVFTSGYGDQNEDGVTPSQTWTDHYGEAEFALEFDVSTSTVGEVYEFRLTSPQSTNPTPSFIPTITLNGVNLSYEVTGASSAGEAQAPASVTTDQIISVTGAAVSGDAGTSTSQVDNPRPTVGPFQWASHGLSVNTYGDFSKAGAVSDQGEPSGAAIVGQAEAPTVTGDANYTVTGAAIVGDGDPPTITGDVNYTLTGAQIAAEAGTSTVQVDTSESVTGAEVVGQAGVSTSFATTPVAVTGAQIAGEAEAPTVTGDVNYTLTGAAIAGGAGTSEGVTPDSINAVTGAQIAGEAEAPTVTGDANYTLAGSEIAGEAGTVTATSGVSQALTGAEIAGGADAPTVTGDVNYTLTGSEIAGGAGTSEGATPDVDVNATGAAISGDAGDISVSTPVGKTRELGPHGLVTKYGTFRRDLTTTLTGSGISSEGGNVTVDVTVDTKLSQYAPWGLVTKERNIAPKQGAQENAFANVTGAQITGQQGFPDSGNTTIYVDGVEIAGAAGTSSADAGEDALAQPLGAEISGEAGASSSTVSIDASPSGAVINGVSGDVAGIGNSSAVGQPTGAEIAEGAGTVTVQTDVNCLVTGAEINAQASEVGTDNQTSVSATINPAAISGEAGTVVGDDTSYVYPTGAEINGQAGEPKQVRRRKGGRRKPRRKPRRLFVEIDNELFEVSSQQEALELLQRAREVAEGQAEVLGEAPVIRVVTRAGRPSQSKAVDRAVRLTNLVVNRAFNRARAESSKRARIDREISELLTLKLRQEEEEEEALIALLLS